MNISYSYKNNVRLYALIKKPLKVFTYSLISLCSFVSKNIHENNKTVKHMHHSITVQNLIFEILGQKTGKLEIQYQFWIWTPFFSPQWCNFLWTIYLSSEINFLIIIYLIRISLSVHLIYFWSFKTRKSIFLWALVWRDDRLGCYFIPQSLNCVWWFSECWTTSVSYHKFTVHPIQCHHMMLLHQVLYMR